jgi:hypothetical protein
LKKVKDTTASSLTLRREAPRRKRTDSNLEERTMPEGKDLVPRDKSDLAAKNALPSEAECAALAAYCAKRESKAPMPRTKIEARSGVAHLSFEHADQAIGLACVANAFGTGSSQFASGLLGQLADVSRTGAEIKSTELDFMLTVVRGIGPKDETEALLAAQMAAIHNATMAAARRLNHVDTLVQHDSNANALNKLARTFAAQLEALKRYRSSSEPTAKTQHVTVNDGGQAIVGNVQHGGDNDRAKTPMRSGGPGGPPAQGPALLSDVEAVAPTMPGSGGAGQEGLPLSRRPRRCAGRNG